MDKYAKELIIDFLATQGLPSKTKLPILEKTIDSWDKLPTNHKKFLHAWWSFIRDINLTDIPRRLQQKIARIYPGYYEELIFYFLEDLEDRLPRGNLINRKAFKIWGKWQINNFQKKTAFINIVRKLRFYERKYKRKFIKA